MKKLFLTEANSFLGQRICAKFEHTQEWEIAATRRPFPSPDTLQGESTDIPGVTDWVPGYAQDNVAFKEKLLEADVIICHLSDSSEEAQAAIRMLGNTSFEVEKTFVLVSSVQTWADTFLAEKTEAEAEREAERRALIEAGEELPDEEPEPEEPEELPVFTEDQYQRRVPHRRYDHWKELEKMVKKCNSETLHTYVLFAGLPYGHGEDLMHHIFRAAWHARPLPMYTGGSNVVPTIHVDDLANAVYKVGSSYDTLSTRYMFAVDKGNNTLGQVIQAINTQLGTGETEVVPPARHHTVRGAEHFTIDLRTEPGTVSDLIDEDEWVCPEGLVAGIEKVVGEYQEHRQVTPVRMALAGPPSSGKTEIAKKLCREYRLKHLQIPEIISDYRNHLTDLKNELKAYRKKKKEEKRLAAKEEVRKAAEEAAEEEAAAKAAAAEENPPEEGDEEAREAEETEKENEEAKEEEDIDDGFEVDFEIETPADLPIRGQSDAEEEEEGAASGEEGAAGAEREGAEGEEGAGGTEEDEAAEDDEEDEALALLKEKIVLVERTIKLTVLPPQPTEPVDEDGDPIDAPEKKSPHRPFRGKPYGEIPEAQRDAPLPPEEEKKEEEPRLRPAALSAIVRWRITQRDCRSQGYVLEGYPKNVRDASTTFIVGEVPLPEPDEPDVIEGDEDTAAFMNAVDDKVLPEYFAVLTGKDELFASRVPTDVDSLARFYRRLKAYKENFHEGGAPIKTVPGWFRSIMTNKEGAPRETAVQNIDVSECDVEGNLVTLREWVGAPHFYRPTADEIVEEAKQKELEEERRAIAHIKAEEEALRVAAEHEEAVRQEAAKHQRRYQSIEQEQAEAAAIQAMPMQSYLLQYVVPTLTRGIADCVALRPEDPVDYLGDYLFKFQAERKL